MVISTFETLPRCQPQPKSVVDNACCSHGQSRANRDKLNCIRHRVHHHISGCHGERLRARGGESTLSNNVPNGELWWESV
jgi:hypothetical protein